MSDEAVRKEFEAWAHPQQLHTSYPAIMYDIAWDAWQASRSAAIQECAEATRCYKCEAEIAALKER